MKWHVRVSVDGQFQFGEGKRRRSEEMRAETGNGVRIRNWKLGKRTDLNAFRGIKSNISNLRGEQMEERRMAALCSCSIPHYYTLLKRERERERESGRPLEATASDTPLKLIMPPPHRPHHGLRRCALLFWAPYSFSVSASSLSDS